MNKKVNPNSASEKAIEAASAQATHFEEQLKDLTFDKLNEAPKKEEEEQTKLSQKDIEKAREIYLKPDKKIACADKFNEKFRSAYEFDKEYVHFIAEHRELIGETIEIWTRPYAGMPAEFWKVPTNKPLWAPRYLAEQIKRKSYHKLSMENKVTTSADHMGQYYGTMVAESSVQRLDARPVSSRKSIFMGAS